MNLDAPTESPPPASEARLAADRLAARAGLGLAAWLLLAEAGLSGWFLAVPAPPASPLGRIALAFFALAGAATAGLLTSHLVRASAARLRLLADQSEALHAIEEHLARTPGPRSEANATSAPAAPDPRFADARRAIRAADWPEAQALLNHLLDSGGDPAEAEKLGGELTQARDLAAQTILSRIAAAREVNDPDRVIELREDLPPLLSAEALQGLDRDLGRWFLMLIQRRLRGGTVRPDVAVLAGRVADSLDQTREGASLRAALPTLRRAAGLCPRCSQPYTGLAEACPACVAAALAKPTGVNPLEKGTWAAPPEPDGLDAPPGPVEPDDPLKSPFLAPGDEPSPS